MVNSSCLAPRWRNKLIDKIETHPRMLSQSMTRTGSGNGVEKSTKVVPPPEEDGSFRRRPASSKQQSASRAAVGRTVNLGADSRLVASPPKKASACPFDSGGKALVERWPYAGEVPRPIAIGEEASGKALDRRGGVCKAVVGGLWSCGCPRAVIRLRCPGNLGFS